MNKRTTIFLALLLCVFGLLPVHAQEEVQHPLMEILALIPDIPEVRGCYEGISYMDYAAIVAVRPGAAQPSWEELESLRNSDDDGEVLSAELWLAALIGVRSGPEEFPGSLLWAVEMREAVGFDVFDVERGATFLCPPERVDLFEGDFDETAIEEAFTNRDYTLQELDGMTLWCGPDGCDQGEIYEFRNRNLHNPFGGRGGRNQPLLMFSGYLVSSPDNTLLENYPAILDSTISSLGHV